NTAHARSRKRPPAPSYRAVPDREPAGGQPHLSRRHARVLSQRPQGALTADRDEQLLPSDGVLLHWHAHPELLWHFIARSAGGRRTDCYFHRLDNAEAAG